MAWLRTLARRVRGLLPGDGTPPAATASDQAPPRQATSNQAIASQAAPDQTTPPSPEPTASPVPTPADDAAPATVVGIFQSMSDAGMALTNLDEAGYEPRSISVISDSPRRTRTLTHVRGPLSAVPPAQLPDRLVALGLSREAAAAYRSAIDGGAVVVAVAAPAGAVAAAAEILTDQHAQQVQRLTGTISA